MPPNRHGPTSRPVFYDSNQPDPDSIGAIDPRVAERIHRLHESLRNGRVTQEGVQAVVDQVPDTADRTTEQTRSEVPAVAEVADYVANIAADKIDSNDSRHIPADTQPADVGDGGGMGMEGAGGMEQDPAAPGDSDTALLDGARTVQVSAQDPAANADDHSNSIEGPSEGDGRAAEGHEQREPATTSGDMPPDPPDNGDPFGEAAELPEDEGQGEKNSGTFSVRKFQAQVNRLARRHFTPMTEAGARDLPRRLVLRMETPYPYSFTEATGLYPDNAKEAFGRLIRMERKVGLAEIHERIAEAEFEHSWLYLPDVSLWVDPTYGASPYAESEPYAVHADENLNTYLSYGHPTVEMVHTHPDKVVRQLYEEGDSGYSDSYLLEAATPSRDDLIRHVHAALANPGTRIISRIVSHYGVTSFEQRDASGFAGTLGFNWRISRTSADPVEYIRKALEHISRNITQGGREAFKFTFNNF